MSDALPIFTGDITNANDVARYIASPTNKKFATQDQLIATLIAQIAQKPNFYSDATEPVVANKGDRWRSISNNIEKECIESYTSGTLNKPSKWRMTAGELAKQQVQLQSKESQLNGAFIDQTLQNFSADSKIDPNEKIIMKGYYDEAIGERTDLDQTAVFYGIVADPKYIDYVAKYNAMFTYVNTTISLFADMNADTTVVSGTWNSIWSQFRGARTLFKNLINARSISIIEELQGDVDSVQNNIDTISNDSIISKQEKPALYREWTDVINVNRTKLISLATTLGVTGAVQYTDYITVFNNLNTYLNTTLELFAPLTSDTDLVAKGSNAVEFQSFFNNYYVSQSALDQYLDERFEANIDSNRTEYLTLIGTLANDGIISGGSEKQRLLQTWKDIQSENTNLLIYASEYSVTIPPAYTTAYENLDNYLNIELGIFVNLSTDTTVVTNTFYGYFNLYRTQSDILSEAIVTAQKLAVVTGNPDFAVVKQVVESLADDGIISAGAEKTRMIALWNSISASHNEFLSIASKTGISNTNIVSKYVALEAYLNSLTKVGGGSPNFFVTGEDTAVGAIVFVDKFQQYYVARDEIVKLAVEALSDGLTAVNQSILDVNNDGVVTGIEKQSLYQQVTEFTSEVANLSAQADNLSIVSEKLAMTTAWSDLSIYLDSLDSGAGIFDDMNATTTLTTPQINDWDIKWSNFFVAKQALETVIITTVQANVVMLSGQALLRNGTVTMTGDLNMETAGVKNYILYMKEYALGAYPHASTVNQVYTQKLRIDQEIVDRDTAIGSAITTNVTNQKGVANGLCELDAGALIPVSRLPALAISNVYGVADIPTRDALTVQTGDVAIVASPAKNFIYDGASWIEITVDITGKANISGQVFTGDVEVNKTSPRIIVDDDSGSDTGAFEGRSNGSFIWRLRKESSQLYPTLYTADSGSLIGLSLGNVRRIADVLDPLNAQDVATRGWTLNQISAIPPVPSLTTHAIPIGVYTTIDQPTQEFIFGYGGLWAREWEMTFFIRQDFTGLVTAQDVIVLIKKGVVNVNATYEWVASSFYAGTPDFNAIGGGTLTHAGKTYTVNIAGRPTDQFNFVLGRVGVGNLGYGNAVATLRFTS